MKIETFFEKFDQLADGRNAVAKLREVVRELAVHGKLVPQDPNDEPALTLLDHIASFKAELVSAGKMSGSTSIMPMSSAEGEFELPPNWLWVRFGDVMASRDGERIPVSKEERSTRPKVYDYYGASGVIDKIDGYLFDKSLLLIGEDGANLINRSTPIAFMAHGKYWVNNHAHVVDGISEDFLRYIELHINAINLEPYITGTAQPKMNQAKMNTIPIALPPLPEQRRIVAKVHELMTLCDRLEAQLQERDTKHTALARAALARFYAAPIPANLELLFHDSFSIEPADLRKTILTLAVQGKLVPATGSKRVALGEVIDLISGQHLLADEQNNDGRGIPYLTGPSDFGREHPVPSRWTETPKVVAEPGDILVTVKGAGVGKTNKLVDERTAISRQLMAVRAIRADPDFVHLVLRNAAEHFQESMTGIAIPGIGRKDVLALEAELPPLAEQRRIVAKVDHLMALVDQLEGKLAACRAVATNLMNAVVAEMTAEV